MKGYKVASIQNGTVCLACQLITGKLVRKNRPTQVTGFVVDLAGKVHRRLTNDMGEVLGQPAGIRLPRSSGSGL
jgi:hypothetical protein